MKFREARRIKEISQKKLEETTGIYQVKISRIELNQVEPTTAERRLLEKALNLEGMIEWGDEI